MVNANKRDIILIGGGGHCKSCIDVIESTNQYQIIGILDVPSKVGSRILNYEIIGSDEDIEHYHQTGCCFLVTVGQIKSPTIRKKIYNSLLAIGAEVPAIISPKAVVSSYSLVGKGSIVMHHAFVNAGAEIRENSIINTGAIIEHDVIIGSNTHIATSAIVNGDSKVGDDTFVGSNVCVASQVEICDRCVIGAGSLVVKYITQPGLYFGTPVQKQEK